MVFFLLSLSTRTEPIELIPFWIGTTIYEKAFLNGVISLSVKKLVAVRTTQKKTTARRILFGVKNFENLSFINLLLSINQKPYL